MEGLDSQSKRNEKASKDKNEVQGRSKNASKNIIKNFGRDLLNFVIECKGRKDGYDELFPKGESSADYVESIKKIEKIKKQINGISHLKQLWTD